VLQDAEGKVSWDCREFFLMLCLFEQGKADVIFVASGSEVSLEVDAAKKLQAKGKKVQTHSPRLQYFFVDLILQ